MRHPVRHGLPALLLSCAFASIAPAAAAPLPVDIQVVLSSAADAGDKVLVDTVVRTITANPALADDIVQEAFMQALEHKIKLNPQDTTHILDAARQTGIPLDPARVTSMARNAGVSFGGGASIVAAGVGISPVTVGLAAAVVGGAAVAAGGGGGGGSGGDDSVISLLPGDFETAEYNAQYGLGLINASSAYARGATGSGVIVGIIDTGLDITHPEFSGRIVAAQNFAADRPANDVTDDNSHGTHVAGIIAAAKNDSLIHGVAYDASIMPLRVFEADGDSTTSGFVNAYDYAVAHGADVINGSYGQNLVFSDPLVTNNDQTLHDAMKRATDAGIILVFATGNDGDDNPTIPALYPYITAAHASTGVYTELEDTHDFSDLAGMLLAVTAVDSSGTITDYANRCGVAQTWCLAAPGDAILSTVPGGSTALKSGTSMAAPHVSGAIAVLLDMFPTMTRTQVVQLLLDTADSSFAGYDADLYGQGLLDLELATRPFGVTAIPTLASGEVNLDSSSFTSGGATGDALLKAAGAQNLVFLDSLGRAYSVDIAAFARAAEGLTLQNRMNGFLGQDTTVAQAGSTRMSFTRSGRAMEGSSLDSATFRHDLGDGQELVASFGTSPAAMFGLAATGQTSQALVRSAGLFGNDYITLDEGSSLALSTDSGWSFGSFQGEHEGQGRLGTVAEYRHHADDGSLLAFQGGLTQDENGFLGTQGAGAFAFAKNTPTVFAGVETENPVAAGWNLLSTAKFGMSFAHGADNSLITGMSPIASMSWSLGLARNNLFRQKDRLVLGIGQPLHVLHGHATLSLPDNQSADGAISYRTMTADLAPTAPELRLTASYERQDFGGMVGWSRHPDSLENAGDEGIVLLRWRKSW